jgi:anti-sigma regulatory factor (Ser/Thr protein kinase)
MIQDRAGEARSSAGGTQVHGPALACPSTIDPTAISDGAGGAGDRWLMLAAEMAGLAGSIAQPSSNPASRSWARQPRIAVCIPGVSAGSVRTARNFTIATLHRWGAAAGGHDIATVVSELLTNALRHALAGSGESRGRWSIRLGLLQLRPRLLCAVADPSTAAPVLRQPSAIGETGRGLHIVCALSDRWGYTTSDAGKVVWAAFTAQPAEPAVAGSVSMRDRVPGPAR